MRTRKSRVTAFLMLTGATGVLFASGSGIGCTSLFGDQALAATDMCFIFDCQNGAFGGTVDFCSDSLFESETFTDCPDAIPDDDSGN